MFYEIAEGPSRQITIAEKEYLFFSGTSYLGLSANVEFNQNLAIALKQYGSSFGVSRNGNLKLAIYEEAEKQLAEFVGAESALTLSSGMLAGQAVVQYLKTQDFHFIYAPQAHPANWHEPVVAIPQLSFMEWAADLIENFPIIDKKIILVCNAVDALKLSETNFDFIVNLPKNVSLLIDDSHGLGVMNGGRGVFSQIPTNINLIVVSSLHKAFGIAGGVIFGSQELIEKISKTIFFSACSPITPAYLAAYMASEKLYQNLHQKLKNNVLCFKNNVLDLSIFSYLDDHCVFYTKQTAIYQHLFEQQILIYNVAYPDVNGIPNTRIVLSAWHEEADIKKIASGLNQLVFP
jgi:8-amino-7-oxononanoate synthase